MSEERQPAPFDDVRDALRFALNFRGEQKAPTMTRMMARVRALPKKPTKRARRAMAQHLRHLPKEAQALAWRLWERQYEEAPAKRSAPPGPAPARGLDAAHLAGYVLANFARLDAEHRMVLEGIATRSHEPCACRSPCCSGWRRVAPWARAVTATCLLLERAGDVLRDGRRGLSTQPALRLALVEQYYTKDTRTVTSMAELGGVSMATAAKHREWIHAYLGGLETEAWQRLAEIFDGAGITGAWD